MVDNEQALSHKKTPQRPPSPFACVCARERATRGMPLRMNYYGVCPDARLRAVCVLSPHLCVYV